MQEQKQGLGRTIRNLGAIAAALLLGGCAGMHAHHAHHADQAAGEGRKAALAAPELAKRFIDPGQAVGAIVINRDGETVFIDDKGNVAKPCHLCAPDDKACLAESRKAELPMCKSTTGTTITDITPISIVNHTGSRCILVTKKGLTGFYTYQLCW